MSLKRILEGEQDVRFHYDDRCYDMGGVDEITQWARSAYAALRTAREALDNANASLATCLTHFGPAMPREDFKARLRVEYAADDALRTLDNVLRTAEGE